MSNNKGITLIALVITIIIMLILVGVVLYELGSDNGIIAKARWAEFVTEYELVDEAKEMYAAGKLIDRYDDEAKFTLKSLFTNVAHAEENSDTLYPVDLGKKFYISEAVETLKDTIIEIEGEKYEDFTYNDLSDPERVNLFRVDFSLLNDIEVKREYVINIVSGMLYYIDGESYRDRIYHTLRYGSPKELNEPEEDEEKPDPIPGETEEPVEDPDLKIHYLSGFDEKEYTQTVKQSNSYNVTLNPVEFRKTNYKFLYWKDITNEKMDNKPQNPVEENPTGFVPQTEGYFGIANQIITILDAMWQSDILEIIEENADYVPDVEEVDPDDEDSEEPEEVPAPDAATQTKNEIIAYLSDYQTEIQTIFQSGMSMEGFAKWIIANTEYLTKLEEYEAENWEGEEEPEEEPEEVIFYEDQQNGVDMDERNMWLEAVWTEGFVTLDGNGGKIKGKDTTIIGVEEGKKYGTALDVTPVRENYVFAGWFTESTGGTQKIKTDIFSATDLPNRILYAHWEQMSIPGGPDNPSIVTITYDANGGTMQDARKRKIKTLTENRVKGTKIAKLPVVEAEKSKKDWFFKGWYTSPDGSGVMVDENTIINESMTIYAIWTNEPNLKLVFNGGELLCQYKRSEDIEKKFNQWNPKRYYDGVDTSRVYAIDGKKIPSQDGIGSQLPTSSSYYRKFQKVKVVKNPNGKDYTVRSTFKGWYTEQNGKGKKIGGPSGTRYTYYTSYGDTLYAYWNNKYVVDYNANGGQFGSNETNTWKQRYVFQDKKYPKPTEPRKSQYRFIGWYDSQVGGNKVEVGNKGDNVTGDITLYAHWEKVEFDFTVSNITERSWTMNITPKSDLSNYSIRFQYSLSPKGTAGATVYTTYNGYNLSKTIKNKNAETTYYVWAYITRYGDKIYSDVKEIKTGNLKYSFEITDVTPNGWTQTLTPISDFSGYAIRYETSLSPFGTSGASVSSTTSKTVNDKKQGTKYYVRAKLTKGNQTIYSTPKEVTTLKLEFSVKITNITEKGWTQNIVCSNTMGYSVSYGYSSGPRTRAEL